MRRIFIDAGCTFFDYELKEDPVEEQIVLGLSMPHIQRWPNLNEIADRMANLGYSVYFIVTTRDSEALAHSQVKNGHIGSADEARLRLERVYYKLFSDIYGWPYVLQPYEATVNYYPESINALLKRFGLSAPDIPMEDGNERYYKAAK